MKFGKRRKDADTAAEPTGVTAPTPPPAEPVPVTWAVPEQPAPGAETADTADDDEPATVVDSDAVELPPDPVAHAVAEAPAPAAAPPPPAPTHVQPAAAAYMPPAAAPMPFPASGQPDGVPGSRSSGATSSSHTDAGHAAGTAPSWPEPVMQLANERPELVVGAAFAGGLLLAAILRRLGN